MSLDANLTVAALVSVGQHPKSGRDRRADQDARAVELGLNKVGTQLQLWHVGDPENPALQQYLGMGLPEMAVLRAEPGADAVTILAGALRDNPPDLVLTGERAERGEASGLLPYLLAEALGWPVLTGVADIRRVEDGQVEVLQALPRGQRRALRAPLPAVITVDTAAPAPRQFAFGPGRRARRKVSQPEATPDEAQQQWREAPAKARPKRLAVAKAKSAADRFKAATAKPQGQGGQVITSGSDREKAEAVLNLLTAEGVVR